MKKLILLGLTLSLSAFGDVMSHMHQRLDNYNEVMAPNHCQAASSGEDYAAADHGIMAKIECDIYCKKSNKKVTQMIPSSFIPKSYGLSPGDGSNTNNTVWRSLGVTMKSWSEEVCLQEASEICKGLANTEDAVVKGITSGAWSMNHFPGCHEKVATLSPFDNTVNSAKIPAPMVKSMEVANFGEKTSIFQGLHEASKIKPSGVCKHKMKAEICFGDCVHEMSKGGEWKETLGTPEPLGRDSTSWCMDGFVNVMKTSKGLSKKIQIKACEAFLWSNMMYAHDSGSSCASIRGAAECDKLVNGF